MKVVRSFGGDRRLGTSPRRPSWWAGALQEFHCPPPPSGVDVHCRSFTAHYPWEVKECVARVVQPTARCR